MGWSGRGGGGGVLLVEAQVYLRALAAGRGRGFLEVLYVTSDAGDAVGTELS